MLIKLGFYDYIQKFVAKYRANYSEDDFFNLKELLTVKTGVQMDSERLKEILSEELDEFLYKEFKDKITYNNPKELKDYIKNFLEIYGSNYDIDHFDYLHRLLKEKGFDLDEHLLSLKIDEVEKELELLNFEKKLNSEYSGISRWELDLMTGYEFEQFLKKLFERMGYQVQQTKLSNDQGADLIISKFGEKIVVQAKRYANKVGNKAIQEAVAAIKYYGADKAIVITSSRFTRPAIKLASANNVTLIDGDMLEKLIHRYF